MQTKERATVTLTAETLRAARAMIPDLNLSALFDQALAERVRQARDAQIAESYASHPSDFDDDVDWASLYDVTTDEEQRALAARRPWRSDD